MKPIRKKIFGFDPYEDFDPDWDEPDLQGRGHEHGIFAANSVMTPRKRKRCSANLMFYWPRLRKGGHLIGDDYKNKNVRAGVEKFVAKMKAKPEALGGKYRFVKS